MEISHLRGNFGHSKLEVLSKNKKKLSCELMNIQHELLIKIVHLLV